jgi:hypothetical protein
MNGRTVGTTTTTDTRSRRNRASRRGGHRKARARSPSSKTACPATFSQESPCPDHRNYASATRLPVDAFSCPPRRASTARPMAIFSSARKRESYSAKPTVGAGRPKLCAIPTNHARLTRARGLATERLDGAKGTAAPQSRFPTLCLCTTGVLERRDVGRPGCCSRPDPSAGVGSARLLLPLRCLCSRDRNGDDAMARIRSWAPLGLTIAFAQSQQRPVGPWHDRFRRRALVCRCRSA